jgi:NitT/TauT family transport system substrate-binding protein
MSKGSIDREEDSMTRALFRFVLAAIAGVAFVSTAQAQKVRFTLDFALQGQQSPFILAAEGEYFERAGVNVQVDRGYGSADAITKVASGAYDMAFADIGAMIQFAGKHPDAKVVSVFQVYDVAPMVILSLKKSNIQKPADLSGKRLASPPGASSRVMFPLLAAANGVDVSSIKWLDVTPQLRETLLAQGQTDATTALITDLAGLNNLGLTLADVSVMRFADFGVSIYGHCILTTPEFAEKNPDAVRKVVLAVSQALKDAIADPAKSIEALKKRNPLLDETVERGRLQSVIDNAIATDRVKRTGLSDVDPDKLKRTIEMVAKTFNIPAADPATIYRADFLPARDKLMLK